MTTFADYLSTAGEMPEGGFIGLLVMYSFRNARSANITRDRIEQEFARRGLDTEYLPGEPTPVQAFKNATGEKGNGYNYRLSGVEFFAEIKHVSQDRDGIYRSLWTYKVGADRRHLEGREVGRLTFYKAGRGQSERVKLQLSDDHLRPGERPMLESFLAGVYQDYEWYKTYLYDQPIRQMVMNYVERGLNGIKMLTSGGCYFVHRTRWDELRELSDAVQALSPSFSLTLCPMPDLENLRETVVEAYQNEVVDDVTKLVEKIEDFRKSGRKITTEKVGEFSNEVRTIQAQALEHSRVLGVSQDRTAGALENAHAVLAGIIGQIES